MFAQLFGTPNAFSPAKAEPAAPERDREWNNLVQSIVDEPSPESDPEEDSPWGCCENFIKRHTPEQAATMRFRDAAGAWESCDAEIEHRDEYKAVISAPYALEEGDMLWLEDEHVAKLYVVRRSSPACEVSRLELRAAHVERRTMSRRDDDCLGTLEVLTGDAVESRTVTVNNVSGGGAQIETRDPLPDRAPVRLTFRERSLSGAVRYCRDYQGCYVAGIQFSFDAAAA